jgi:AcrR family transcriptional regulator
MTKRNSKNKTTMARRQEQILNAALEIFSQKGFAATVPDIARQAGVAAGTIYIYYPGKRELFIAVIERLMVSPLLNIFEKEPGSEFKSTLSEALRDRLQVIQSIFVTHLTALISEIQRDPELRGLFMEKLIHPFLSRMEEMCLKRIASGEFRQMDPAIVVRVVGGMMIGMNLLKSLEGDTSPFIQLSQEKTIIEIMNFILYGLINTNRIIEPENI